MKRNLSGFFLRRVQGAAFLAALLTFSVAAEAGTVDLATVPLATATTTKVLPNLMYIQDNSGSMNWDYVPDKIVDRNYCKGGDVGTTYRCCLTNGGTAISTNSRDDVCNPHGTYTTLRGMPPFLTASFNRIFYNPAITYSPPRNADGTEKTVSFGSNYGAVPYDGYNVQTSTKVDLKNNWPDVEWCTDNNFTDCLRNDNYLLPGVVNSKSYTVQHATTSGGSMTKSFATGPVTSPTASLTRAVGPFYYVVVPGEYCTDANLTTCQATKDSTYTVPATLRWCTTSALTTCKATADASYTYPRYPTVITSLGSSSAASVGEITLTSGVPRSNSNSPGTNCGNIAADRKVIITDLTLNGISVLATKPLYYCNNSNNQNTRNQGLIDLIAANMGNGFSGNRQGNMTLAITTPSGTAYNGATLNYTMTTVGFSISQAFAGGQLGSGTVVVPGEFKRVDIVTGQTYGNIVVGGQTIVDRSGRTDCAARPTCTYDEELLNFANWVAWYRSRMQMMKTTVSQSFKTIDTKYRVGLFTLNDQTNNYLAISKFTTAQKASWYSKLFALDASGGTPLRTTLARVGRIFAGQDRVNSADEDPVEYSCQQNFALATTDGYWNDGSTPQGLAPFGSTTTSNIGNQDASPTPRPLYEGPTATSNTLADVAKYFYDTDLRNANRSGYNSTTADNCTVTGKDDDTGASYTRNVCADNVFVTPTDSNVKQHLTTFSLGLGVDGTIQYQSNYDSIDCDLNANASTDWCRLKTGTGTPTLNWPVPTADNETTVDDLWHAGVNGRGKYFSAKDPRQLSSGLNSALASITAKIGAGAAAATSTLNPVSGDNYAYVASYTTAKWTGNLEKRPINTATGDVSETALWCAENVVAAACSSPSSEVTDTSGSSTVTYCVTPGQTTCPGGTLVGTDCKVEVQAQCTGTMRAKVGVSSDTRTIKVRGSLGALVDFDSTFAANNPGYFDSTKLSGLSQWSALSSAQQTAAQGATLVSYLRGNTGYEDSPANATPANRLFRFREAVLGDLIEAKPNYMGKPKFSYVDPGYAEFIIANASRAGTVYAAANDGMLHAFNAANGNELWAYIPTPVLPNLWKLADNAYASNHASFINGSPVVTDICSTNCANSATDPNVANRPVWKTILVGGLNGGGRGYYALDVTNPSSPSLLWEYTNADDADLGYTYGNPVVTKKSDGTWVVAFASGYNNTSSGSGRGYLYVLNANSGVRLSKIDTTAGDATTPSGLAKISAWVDNLEKNNTAGYVYGTDLLGNVWRFDINAASAFKFAVLRDSLGGAQPITTAPELGLVNGQRVVFVGTGKYLETADLTTTQRQSIYAIKDEGATTTLDTPRTGTGANVFVLQTLTVSSTDSAVRVASTNTVDWSSQRGWYIDLPAAQTGEGSERVNVGMDLIAGILAVPTTVPANSVCTPGGYGWFNYLDYKTGGAIDPANPNNARASNLVSNVIVGVNVLFIGGKPVFRLVTANKPTPEKYGEDPPTTGAGSSFQNKRAVWRELVQ